MISLCWYQARDKNQLPRVRSDDRKIRVRSRWNSETRRRSTEFGRSLVWPSSRRFVGRHNTATRATIHHNYWFLVSLKSGRERATGKRRTRFAYARARSPEMRSPKLRFCYARSFLRWYQRDSPSALAILSHSKLINEALIDINYFDIHIYIRWLFGSCHSNLFFARGVNRMRIRDERLFSFPCVGLHPCTRWISVIDFWWSVYLHEKRYVLRRTIQLSVYDV